MTVSVTPMGPAELDRIRILPDTGFGALHTDRGNLPLDRLDVQAKISGLLVRTELTTEFVRSAFYQIVNTRLMTNKKTIISTNLSPAELSRRYGANILSRIEGSYRILPFFGDDIRTLKK